MRATAALALLVLALTPATGHATGPASGSASGAPAHEVILADGSHLKARTRPNIMFGVVSFLGLDGHVVTLPTSSINLVATRASLAPVSVGRPSGGVWDERAVASLSTQLLAVESGDARVEALAGSDEAASADTAHDAGASEPVAPSTPADLAKVNADLIHVQAELARRGRMDTESIELRRQQRALAAQAQALSDSYGGNALGPDLSAPEERHDSHDGHSH